MSTQLSLLRFDDRQQASPEQLRAAHAGPEGAILIAAGPGTGKTFTMVERFVWLVRDRQVPLDAVLAVTFTEKAAEELRERIADELAGHDPRLAAATDSAWIGTFHSVCRRLLQEDAYLVGVPRDLKVLDEIGQRLLIDQLSSRLRSGSEPTIDLEKLSALQPDELAELLRHGLQFVLKLKGRGITPDEFRTRAIELHATHDHAGQHRAAADAELEAVDVLHAVFSSYERSLQESKQLDFDDLILLTIRALRSVDAFRVRCRERFRFLLVDEFQDSNRIQMDLIRLLSADGFANTAVVGDAKQSIYGWRDADVDNIRTRFPGRLLPLTRNRRSVQEILDLATDFIRRDPAFADEPHLVADRGRAAGVAVTVVTAADPEQEATLVVKEIQRLVSGGLSYSDIALLSRTLKYLPPEFEQQLQRARIPYITSSGGGFFDREEVKDVVALLRLTDNPVDDAALVRVLQGPVVRLHDDGMYALARRRSGRRGVRLRDCLDESVQAGHPELSAEVVERALKVLAVTDRLASAKETLTVADVLNQLLEETGYLRHCQLRSQREGPRALLNLRKVFRMANRFERDSALAGIGDFVRHLDEMMEAEVDVVEAQHEALGRDHGSGRPDAVSLLTIHKSKGLEFPAVFLLNVRPPHQRDTERLFFEPDGFGFVMKWWRGDKHPCYSATLPSANALRLARQEQRRLVYVALTRARDHLYVSASRQQELPEEVEVEEGDHFAEIRSWALTHPDHAVLVTAEQLELPSVQHVAIAAAADAQGQVARLLDRMRRLAVSGPTDDVAVPARQARLSFSQLQLLETCPVRYRFSEVWQVPAPPDELLPAVARSGGGDLGAAVHTALGLWHGRRQAEDLASVFAEVAEAAQLAPESTAKGREMLARYAAHPFAHAPTLGTETEFNLRVGTTRIKGLVDRVAVIDRRTALIDYKTNRELDGSLLDAYRTQLRLYGMAARAGLLPGDPDALLYLFDLRRSEALEVEPDEAGVLARVEQAAGRIQRADYSLGPEHASRPCFSCSYRPICAHARR